MNKNVKKIHHGAFPIKTAALSQHTFRNFLKELAQMPWIKFILIYKQVTLFNVDGKQKVNVEGIDGFSLRIPDADF